MGAEARIKELGITLPNPPKPLGNYIPAVRVGNLLFLSGHGPIRVGDQPLTRGKVGRDMSIEDAYKVAREVGINLLGSARTALGSLDKVKRVVKVLGMVNAVESFGATVRASVSAEPPARNGTITRTGLFGYCAPATHAASARTTASAVRMASSRFRIFMFPRW